MKQVLVGLAIAVASTVVMAQQNAASVSKDGELKAAPAHGEMQRMDNDAEPPVDRPGCHRQKMLPPGCVMERGECFMMKNTGGAPCGWQRDCIRPFPHRFILFKLFAAMTTCMILCGLLHILLTIVVFNDMRALGRVNGLWIPIVLIGGVFGAITYALMRQAPVAR